MRISKTLFCLFSVFVATASGCLAASTDGSVATAIAAPAPAPTTKTLEERIADLEKASGATEVKPTPVAATPVVKTLEQRVDELEKAVADLAKAVNIISQNAVSVDAARGLAQDLVSLQDQITALKRSMIPKPVPVPVQPKKPAK